MDPTNPNNFQSNVVNTSRTYSPQPGSTPGPPPDTLPPLQPQSTNIQSLYTTPTPRTPGTPNPPGSASGYAPPTSTLPPTTRPAYMMSTAQYPPQPHAYAASSSMVPQPTSAVSHPHPIAPALAPAPVSRPGSSAVPPSLRPIASGGVMPAPAMGYGQNLAPQSSMMGEAEHPTHVVGSQGRRGILPSAPGRPPATPAGSTGTKSTVPVKDADGKFPCPHCVKTYLHAKHLKRHLLRHTGDRPYMCVLCRDTFSRSDILKRHFQKCSIRRGNPTGVSHLSHPSAHVKKYKESMQKSALDNGGDLSQMNGLGNMPGDNIVHQYGGMPVTEDPNRDRRAIAGPVMGGPTYSSDVPTTMTSTMNAQMGQYNMPQGQNGMPMFTTGSNSNQQSNVDWSQMFQAGAQHGTYVNAFLPNVGQTQIAIKDPSHIDPASTGGVSGIDERSLFFSNSSVQQTMNPYQQLSNRILHFLSSLGVMTSSTSNLSLYFSPDNIKDFLANYTHFHIHLAMLHIPTFRIMEAYTGLLVAMCCVGACYSNRVSSDQAREMMSYLRTSLQRDSRVLKSVMPDMQDVKSEHAPLGAKSNDIEELQALMLMQILFLWNGGPEHREIARSIFPMIAKIVRKLGFLVVASELNLYSPLHQPTFSPQSFDIATFDWHSWAEQEKRLRLMHIIFLCDSALCLYFNESAQFDGSEIRVPLPADDAAWEATLPLECAEALGLHGPAAAKLRNPGGTQRSKQPELYLCLKALHSRDHDLHEGTTNLYGKFVMIHALLMQLRRAQVEGQFVVSNEGVSLAQSDWMYRAASNGGANGNISGRGTPVTGGQPVSYSVGDVVSATEKFKLLWDRDMMAQFPPSTPGNLRRFGFCRDAIHYYWVAKYLAKHAKPADYQVPAEHRFQYIMSLLKSVKTWVESDGAARGEEMGSIGAIDKDYGVVDLAFDMTRLFAPIPTIGDAPR